MTQLRLQLRDAADREARLGSLGRLWRTLRWDASRPALAATAAVAVVALFTLVALPFLRSDETLPAGRDLRIAAHTEPNAGSSQPPDSNGCVSAVRRRSRPAGSVSSLRR